MNYSDVNLLPVYKQWYLILEYSLQRYICVSFEMFDFGSNDIKTLKQEIN